MGTTVLFGNIIIFTILFSYQLHTIQASRQYNKYISYKFMAQTWNQQFDSLIGLKHTKREFHFIERSQKHCLASMAYLTNKTLCKSNDYVNSIFCLMICSMKLLSLKRLNIAIMNVVSKLKRLPNMWK